MKVMLPLLELSTFIITNLSTWLDLGSIMNTPYQTSISPFVSDSSTTPIFGGGGMFTPAVFTPFGGNSSPGYMSPGYVSPFYGGELCSN